MLTLDTLNTMLAVSEEGMVEEMILALLASPQLVIFFEKFPRLKNAVTADLPRWREALRSRLKDARVPPELTEEVMCYQQSQLLSTPQFIVQLPQILALLHRLHSPYAAQAKQLTESNSTFTPALHTLFLQRWRLSLVVQATTLNQQLLEEEREQLLSDVQERMTLSGQLEPTLAENDNAAGRLWDMSTGQLKRGDYQLIVKYGEFLAAQPELMQLAEQLGRSREAKSVPKKDAPMETFRTLVREPATVPEQVDGIQQGDDILRLLPPELATLGITELEYEFYRRLVEKQLLTYRLHGEAWREKVTERPVVHQDIAVQTGVAQLRCGAPVIIIRRAYIMAVAIAQFTADPHQKNGAKFFGDRAFAPFRIQIRIARQQLLAVNKLNLLWQERRQTKLFMHFRFRRLNSCPYSLYCAF